MPTEKSPDNTMSRVERSTRVVLATLAAGALTYSFIHVGQQLLQVSYRRHYRILIPSLVSAAVASCITVTKAKDYGLLGQKKIQRSYSA